MEQKSNQKSPALFCIFILNLTPMRFCLLTLVALLLACKTKPSDDHLSDSVKTAVDSIVSSSVNENVVYEDATSAEADSLFNTLVRNGIIQGEFSGFVQVDNFIDADHLDGSRNLLAGFFQAGEGEYTGIREGQTYATVHSVLAIFESTETGYRLVDYITADDGAISNLVISSTEAEAIQLTSTLSAVMLHSKSSEEGAGDSGYNRDNAEIYVLLNDKITSVLQIALEDSGFSSNEIDAYYQYSNTSQLEILDIGTNGLFDLKVTTTSTSSGTEEEESDTQESTEEENQGPVIYKWNGNQYIKVEE